jgi:hypothetical protein
MKTGNASLNWGIQVTGLHSVDQFLDTKTNTNLYTKVPSKFAQDW